LKVGKFGRLKGGKSKSTKIRGGSFQITTPMPPPAAITGSTVELPLSSVVVVQPFVVYVFPGSISTLSPGGIVVIVLDTTGEVEAPSGGIAVVSPTEGLAGIPGPVAGLGLGYCVITVCSTEPCM
jgi:hypothetical protein